MKEVYSKSQKKTEKEKMAIRKETFRINMSKNLRIIRSVRNSKVAEI